MYLWVLLSHSGSLVDFVGSGGDISPACAQRKQVDGVFLMETLADDSARWDVNQRQPVVTRTCIFQARLKFPLPSTASI
jgi:hypothetical protein